MSNSSPCHTIKTLWSTIEQFVDLPSTVVVAQTCRGLRDEIVDADTRRIKVSHLIVGRRGDGPWGRIPNYLPNALDNVHWPSIRRVDLSFAHEILPRSSDGTNIEDATASCFPLFVSQLRFARHLESLRLDVSRVLHISTDDEDDGDDENTNVRYEPLVELFGRNIARCAKLRDLKITTYDPYCPFMMREFMLALTPVLAKQRDLLRRFQWHIPRWAPDDVEEDAKDTLLPVATDFFRNVLSCPNLRVLEIDVNYSPSLSDALVGAAGRMVLPREGSFKRQKMQRTGGDSLHRLWLHLSGMYDHIDLAEDKVEEYLEGAKTLLELFSDCEQFEDVRLGLPSQFWSAHSNVVAGMLNRQSKLSAVAFSFGAHSDSGGEMLELLRRCAIDGNKCKIGDLTIVGLSRVDGKGLFKLLQDLRAVGAVVQDLYKVWNSDGRQEVVNEDTKVIPERVGIGRIWIRHEENFKRREHDLGEWY